MKRTNLIVAGLMFAFGYGCAGDYGGARGAGSGYGQVDNRPCAVNFSVGGVGQFRSFEDFPALTPAVALEKAAGIINSSGYRVLAVDQRQGVLSATHGSTYTGAGSFPTLQGQVRASPRGGARVILNLNRAGLPGASAEQMRHELCILLAPLSH